MESPITQTTQHVSESEWSIDTLELTDEDLEKVTGASWGHFRHSHFRHFNNSTALAINNVAITNGRAIAINNVAFAG
jgi:hypothetical protein